MEQTRGKRQLIQSGLTRFQSEQPHQLLCPKMDERGSKTETKQRQNSSKEETSLIDTALCWLDVGRMCCHSGINGLRRLLLHCVVVNGIMSFSPTSEPLSLDCSLVLQLLNPLSHLLIKWLQLIGCSVFITAKLASTEIRLMSGTCSFLFSLFFSSFSLGSRATKQRK